MEIVSGHIKYMDFWGIRTATGGIVEIIDDAVWKTKEKILMGKQPT